MAELVALTTKFPPEILFQALCLVKYDPNNISLPDLVKKSDNLDRFVQRAMMEYINKHRALGERIAQCRKCKDAMAAPVSDAVLGPCRAMITALHKLNKARKDKHERVRAYVCEPWGTVAAPVEAPNAATHINDGDGPGDDMYAARDMYAGWYVQVQRHFATLEKLASLHVSECDPALKEAKNKLLLYLLAAVCAFHLRVFSALATQFLPELLVKTETAADEAMEEDNNEDAEDANDKVDSTDNQALAPGDPLVQGFSAVFQQKSVTEQKLLLELYPELEFVPELVEIHRQAVARQPNVAVYAAKRPNTAENENENENDGDENANGDENDPTPTTVATAATSQFLVPQGIEVQWLLILDECQGGVQDKIALLKHLGPYNRTLIRCQLEARINMTRRVQELQAHDPVDAEFAAKSGIVQAQLENILQADELLLTALNVFERGEEWTTEP